VVGLTAAIGSLPAPPSVGFGLKNNIEHLRATGTDGPESRENREISII
jgi:hypothetical protein